jgi:hypothetical protein
MANSKDFEKIIESYSDDIKILARQTRKLIYTILPEVVEIVWVQQRNAGFGTGEKKMTEHFCWIMPATNHVTLGFNYGAELPDPGKLLEGTGKLFRHFKVKTSSDLANPDLLVLLKFATSFRIPAIPSKTDQR